MRFILYNTAQNQPRPLGPLGSVLTGLIVVIGVVVMGVAAGLLFIVWLAASLIPLVVQRIGKLFGFPVGQVTPFHASLAGKVLTFCRTVFGALKLRAKGQTVPPQPADHPDASGGPETIELKRDQSGGWRRMN